MRPAPWISWRVETVGGASQTGHAHVGPFGHYVNLEAVGEQLGLSRPGGQRSSGDRGRSGNLN